MQNKDMKPTQTQKPIDLGIAGKEKTMKDTKKRILQMVEQGKITAQEGLDLLQMVEAKAKAKRRPARASENIDEQRNQAQYGELVKLSANEYEVLPVQRGKKRPGQKAAAFSKSQLFGGRKLVLQVEEKGKRIVNLKLPLLFVSPFLKGILSFSQDRSPQVRKYMDMVGEEDLRQYFERDIRGVLLDVYDEEDDTHVYIAVE